MASSVPASQQSSSQLGVQDTSSETTDTQISRHESSVASWLPQPVYAFFAESGSIVYLFVRIVASIFTRPFQFREFVQQGWFIASVTIIPSALVAIPFGAIVALQTGSLVKQFGAESFTGAAGVLAVVQQGAPLVTSLLIAGAAGSAVTADLGSRTIREEIDAMNVLGVDPIARLVAPRVLAMMFVAMLLNGFVSVVGIAGGYVFNVLLQGGTPGAYVVSFSSLAQLPDLIVAEIKAVIFGLIAGVIASHRGLTCSSGPKGVGEAVNIAVVVTFLLLFFANVVLTGVYMQVIPPKGG